MDGADEADEVEGPSLGVLLHDGDLAGLVRAVDRAADAEDWATVTWLRERCHAASEELGKQLWGAAQYAEYRLALHGPAELAAAVVAPGAARFALGPLTEVVAQHHTFDELADGLDEISATAVAQERVLRGEDLTDEPRAGLEESGLPGRLEPFEPRYALPTYRADERLDGGPAPPAGEPRPVTGAPGAPRELPAVARALTELVEPWVTQSGGEAHVATVAGDADAAITALVAGAATLTELTVSEALAMMAWVGGSGGVHGRRRGGAAGRGAAWWVGHAVTGLAFPAEADELEFHLEDRRWFTFDALDAAAPGAHHGGWALRLVVEGPSGWAAAIDAHDRDEPDGAH